MNRTREGGADIRIGLLRLTDAAPVVVARECGFFAAHGVRAELSVEPSWANIADKLAFGRLDAAVMLPPLALAMASGLRGRPAALTVPMTLSLNGNAITLADGLMTDLFDGAAAPPAPLEAGRALAAYVRDRSLRPRIAVVHVFSTHNLLLRYWLAASGVDPDRDVEITVVPPADMVEALKHGRISGFCAGAPWGEMAALAGVGRPIALSSAIWNNHPEKCLAVADGWSKSRSGPLDAVLGALLEAAEFCDRPENASDVAGILASPRYLALDPAVIRASLPGAGSLAGNVDISVFSRYCANFPWRSHVVWFLEQMRRWGFVQGDLDSEALARRVYRPERLRSLTLDAGRFPKSDAKVEGAHNAPWRFVEGETSMEMGADGFCDGAIFDPTYVIR